MPGHVGEICFFCEKKLTENDDIVVCPDCGTPYHRACWQKNGKCVNEMLHLSGGTWQGSASDSLDDEVLPRRCPNCGTENDDDTVYCTNCGAYLGEEESGAKKKSESEENILSGGGKDSAGMTLREQVMQRAEEIESDREESYGEAAADEDMDGVRLGDVSDFVEKNQRYYMPKFLRFRDSGHRITINFPCIFFPHLYLAYRKMWLPAIILTLVYALLQVPRMAETLLIQLPDMITAYSEATDVSGSADVAQILTRLLDAITAGETVFTRLASISSYLDICAAIVFALLGNWIYYRFVLRSIKKIAAKNFSEPIYHMNVKQKGGTNFWGILVMLLVEYAAICLFTFLFMVGMLIKG